MALGQVKHTTSMRHYKGDFSWICEDPSDRRTSCLLRCGIDGLNLLFLFLFCLILLGRFIRKFPVRLRRPKKWSFGFVSACAVITGIGYILSGLWTFQEKRDGFMLASLYLLRGLVWMFLAASLIIQLTKLESILILFWCVSFSVLISLLNVEVLLRKDPVRIIDMLSWPVNLLLLFCSSTLLKAPSQENSAHGLEEPLVGKKGDKKKFSKPGWFDRLTFSWINSLLHLGHSRPLQLDDIPPLELKDEALAAYQIFAHEFDQLTKKSLNPHRDRNMVLKALFKCNKYPMILIGFYAIFRTLSVVAAPVLLYAFVKYSAEEERDLRQGLLLVGLLVIVKVVESLSQRHWFFGARRFGMRMRSAVMVAVFRKLLKLSSSGRRNHSAGEIVNYIAVDAYRLGEFPWWFHTTWTLLLQLVLAVDVLFGVVGMGALPGLVPLTICGLLNFPFAKMLQKCQTEFMVAQDERLRATSEVLNSMKIIKLQSWEENFKAVIESLRNTEFKWLSEAQIKKSYGTVLYWMSPMLVSSVVFAGCAIFRSAPLNASTIFTILAILRVMSGPVRMLPEALSMLIQVKVSLDRLDVFLCAEELPEGDVKRISFKHSEYSVRVQSGVFSWNQEKTSPTLKDLTLYIKQGQKVAICGPVGAGKSSLLHALLGEIPKISGDVEVHGSVAYVAQTAWVQSGTIRDNILFGKPMEMDRYKKAVKVSALDKDIDNFDHGDLTEIGQRGLNMSGGQKQRIQLARAVYNDADTYLLDDPFSAVDAHTAATLFHECVMAALEKKTVVLVTHQVEFLTEADRILVMEGGQVTQSGTYEELLRAGTAFEKLVTAHQDAITTLESKTNGEQDESEKLKGDMMESKGFSLTEQMSQEEISNLNLPTVQLTEDEEMETDIGWKPYFDYIHTPKGYVQIISLLFNQLAFVIFQILSTYWLALADKLSYLGSSVLIGVYAGISAVSCLFVYMRTLSAALLGLKASKAFFSCLMNSVFKAPMSFFDSTPVGRILTRASSDMSVLDFDIPYALAFALTGAIEVLSTIGIMAAVTWQVLVVAIPVVLLANYVQGYYLASARTLIRINGTTKAPVMSYAAETSLGVVSIRAFCVMERFIKDYLRLVDTDASLFFYTNAATEWVLMRVEALQNLTVITATLLLVLLPRNTIAPGLAGLSLSYAITLTSAQVFLTRFHCNLANSIISVERIKQYIHIPSDAPAIVEDKRPPSSWPSEGRVDIDELKVKYRPNAPLVLKGITCTFKAGERVGVVGRTGSGKSTLISALFRLVEPVSGRIVVDGLDICSIGLKDLRLKLSIIPQEPALFRGSIRGNMDPLGLYSDHEIWEALDKCQLGATVRALPHLLDASVSDEGQNWSVGQRQLFCLGRVLLKRNKILVLDEATASIDSVTDAILQQVIRKESSGCTVITIAHRVPTVTDSDMVMVLSYGKLIEYEKPSKLMETNSYFAKLVAEYWANCRRGSAQDFTRYLSE